MLINIFFTTYNWMNAPRDLGIKGEFISLANPIALCIIWKTILYWSIIAIEPKADFSLFWGY